MPRGVPNPRRDEVPLRFTQFNIPPQMNQKQGASLYLKSEEQTLWGRNKRLAKNAESATPLEGRRGSNVIVIHPGTRFLRIGRASDVFPLTVPHVIARKSKVPVSPPVHLSSIAGNSDRHEHQRGMGGPGGGDAMDVDRVSREPWDPTDPKISPIASSLRERMMFYKLNIVSKATELCTSFNEQVRAEVIPDHNDPYRVEWIDGASIGDVLVGEKALHLADPHRLGYTVRWPFRGGRFNSFDYAHAGLHALANDVEAIWRSVLGEELKIPPETFKGFSVVLIVPDLFERQYVRELVHVLLVQMGFKQACVQQYVSTLCCVVFGAGAMLSTADDLGIDERYVRISLNMGGDDITGYLLALLEHVRFPYRDANLSHSYDWSLIENLKAKICTLAEADVAMNVYDFVIRRPGRSTEKYAFRAYNEIILGPMCIFEPRVIEFERKLVYMHPLWNPEVGEEIVEQANDQIRLTAAQTQAMIISTQHLLPPPMPAPPIAPPPLAPSLAPAPSSSSLAPAPSSLAPAPSFPLIDPAVVEGYGRPVFAVAPQTAHADDAGPTIGQFSGRTQSKFISLDASDFEASVQGNASWTGPGPGPGPGPNREPPSKEAGAALQNQAAGERDPQGSRAQPQAAAPTDASGHAAAQAAYPPPGAYPGGFGIDVAFEAGKLPLDVAIFNSARAAGGDEKIRKYLQAVLVVGGTARVPGMAHALESRLQAIATPLVVNMEKVQIIPPPRDVDPRVLCWKGGAVLGKMEAVADLWVGRHDWEVLGMRSLKERSFFL
ncbi:hypothetical protein JB92DRAFT_3081847 [Gautieria morchelliformis]|nr:hypothetical protein JB92DRAFT_3081847 [Gautieria morchelliformis]